MFSMGSNSKLCGGECLFKKLVICFQMQKYNTRDKYNRKKTLPKEALM